MSSKLGKLLFPPCSEIYNNGSLSQWIASLVTAVNCATERIALCVPSLVAPDDVALLASLVLVDDHGADEAVEAAALRLLPGLAA